ncbi:hypothetical protein [Sphingopyxis granuli]|uniref:hypothetical protein n=1 Tax=Sphingopyxis granuli TaxID=267128 RepID=UPI0012E8070E|nr:hypothetical protein [Sphingopyxis granuli]
MVAVNGLHHGWVVSRFTPRPVDRSDYRVDGIRKGKDKQRITETRLLSRNRFFRFSCRDLHDHFFLFSRILSVRHRAAHQKLLLERVLAAATLLHGEAAWQRIPGGSDGWRAPHQAAQ